MIAALGVGGNDLRGGDGTDVLVAVGGANFVRGNRGTDVIAAGGLANFLYGGSGSDVIVAIGGGNFVYGDADEGDDLGSGAGSNEAETGRDVIVSFGAGNVIWAEGGNDIVTSFGAVSVVDGGAGDDIVVSIASGSILKGGTGDDVLAVSGGGSASFGEAGDDIIISLSALDLTFGGTGDDLMIAAGPSYIGFHLGDQGQDVLVALGGFVRIIFGDNPFTAATGEGGSEDEQRAGILQFAVDTFNGFEFTDFEFEDLSLPTLPTVDDLDEGFVGSLEGFVLGTWNALTGIYDRLEQIPDLFNGSTLSLDRLETAFTAIELPNFVKPDFGDITLDLIPSFGLGSVEFDLLEGLGSPRSPDFGAFDLETERFDAIDVTPEAAFEVQSIFAPDTENGSDIGLMDFNSMLPNLSTGFDPGSVSQIAQYFPGESLDTSGLPDLGFADALNLDAFSLPDAGSLFEAVSGLKLPGVSTLKTLGGTLEGLFDFSKGTGLIQPGEGRGDFNLPDLSFPSLSLPTFDLFNPSEGDDSDVIVSLAGASFAFGQEDDDVIIGAGFANLLFGGEGADIIGGIAKGNLISGGEGDDIAVGVGLLNLMSGGAGSDILGAVGKGNIVAGGTDGDILVAGGLANLLLGGSGRDLIGGAGKLNIIAAGADNDILLGGGKFNIALGGAGDDLAVGGGTLNLMFGGEGGDFILGGGKFNGGFAGADILVGGGKFNVLDGDIGDDLILGGGSFNVLYARSGNDALVGAGKFNTLIGGQGTDLVLGGGKFNLFMSGTEADTDEQDNDILIGGGKYNTFFAGGGDDLAFVGGSLNHVYMGTGQDIVISYADGLNMVFGQEEADLIFGAGVGNVYSGGTGNDLLFGFGRDDDDEPEGEEEGSVGDDVDIKSDGSVTLFGDWGDDLLIGVGNATDMSGGDGQDKLFASGFFNFLKGDDGYDSLIAFKGLSALDGGTGNDIIYSKGSLAKIGLPSLTQIVFDGGDVQGGKGSDLIWSNGLDIEVFGDVGVSIFNPEDAPDLTLEQLQEDRLKPLSEQQYAHISEDGLRDYQDGDDYIIVSGSQSEAYGQGGDDALVLFGNNHRALGGDGDDLMLAFGPDTELRGDAGNDTLINLGERAQSHGGAGDDVVLGKGFALLGWLSDSGATVRSEFSQNVLLLKENIEEFIGNTVSSAGSFREFDGSQITADVLYLGRDGSGSAPAEMEPSADDIRDSEAQATVSHIFALIDEYGADGLGSFLAEVDQGNFAAFAPSYDTLAGDVTQAADAVVSPLAGRVVALEDLENLPLADIPLADIVLAAELAPILMGGADDDVLGGLLGLSSLRGGSGDDTYRKGISERVTILDEELGGGEDTLIIDAHALNALDVGDDGFGLRDLVFEKVDARNDGTADDLLIRVLSGFGEQPDSREQRSITVVLDQYQSESAIETLVLRSWDPTTLRYGSQSYDLQALLPQDVTLDATVDGDALAKLVDFDEAALEQELLAYDAYAEMFLYSDFDIEQLDESEDGDDLNSLETVLDEYFRTLGDGASSGTAVAEAGSLEAALDGRAFDGAPVLDLEAGSIIEEFDEGALLKLRRFNDNGARYESTLTSNGTSVGLKELAPDPDSGVVGDPDGTPLFKAEARGQIEILLEGLSGTQDRAEVVAEALALEVTGDLLPEGSDFHFAQLSLTAFESADAAVPVAVEGGAEYDTVLVLREGDLNGMAVAASSVDHLLLKGAMSVETEDVATVSVASDDTDAQHLTFVASDVTVDLGDGENVFDIVSGTGDFTGGVDQDTFVINLAGLETGEVLNLDGGAGAGDIYHFVTTPGQSLGTQINIAIKGADILDFSELSPDVFVMPSSNGVRLQNDVSQLNIAFPDIDLPQVLWSDGVVRTMLDFNRDGGTAGDDFYLIRQIGGGRSVRSGGGDDVVIVSEPEGRVRPGRGDDVVELRESPVVGTSEIEWIGGNDHYLIDYTTGTSGITFAQGVKDDYIVGVGSETATVTYFPTGETITIDGLPTHFRFKEDADAAGYTTYTAANYGRNEYALTTPEDFDLTLFDYVADGVPVGAETVLVSIDTIVRNAYGFNDTRTQNAGDFVTASGQVITNGDVLSVEEYLGLRFDPADNFYTGNYFGGIAELPTLEAEFFGADGIALGRSDVTIEVESRVDRARFFLDGPNVFPEGGVPEEGVGLVFNDFDGYYDFDSYSSVRFRLTWNDTMNTGSLSGGSFTASSYEEFAWRLASWKYRWNEHDYGTVIFELRMDWTKSFGVFGASLPGTDFYFTSLNVYAQDDLEFFTGTTASDLELGENQNAALAEFLRVGTFDGRLPTSASNVFHSTETGLYEVHFEYAYATNFLYTEGWNDIGDDNYQHGAGAIFYNEVYDTETGLGSNRLVGTIDQIYLSLPEIRIAGENNVEGDGSVDIDLYKVSVSGSSRQLQDSYTRDFTLTKGVNRVVAETGKDIYLTQDEGPVEVAISEPYDEDFPLDEQPVFPVRIFRLPEFGHLETPDGEIITLEYDAAGNLKQYDSTVLTSLLYVPDADAANDPDRDWAYEDFMLYQVLNPAGSTTLGQNGVSFFVYDDRVTETVDDGAGGTVTRPVGFEMGRTDSGFSGPSNSIFYGGDGDDVMRPYGGVDMMLGGGGSDVFVIDEAAGEFNVIGDFEVGVDRLDLGLLSVVAIEEVAFFNDPEQGLVDDTLDTVLSLSSGSVLVLEDITNFIDTQNVAPTGALDSFAVAEFTGFEDEPPVLTGNVLSNDSDLNGDAIILDPALVQGPAFGELEIDATGAFTYRPYLYATGTDVFSYVPSDGTDAGRRVSVSIDIADALNTGGADADELEAGDAGGNLAGAGGADTLIGGAGNDILIGGADADLVTTGGGADQISGTQAELNGDVISDFSVSDVLIITDLDTAGIVVERRGADSLLKLAGGAEILLEDIPATADFVQTVTPAGTEIRLLPAAQASVLSEGADRLIAATSEPAQIFADAGDDAVQGGSGDDKLIGGSGDDLLIGGAGNDLLFGGTGRNVLVGGAGADVFAVFVDLGGSPDVNIIRGFTPGEDVLELFGPGATEDVILSEFFDQGGAVFGRLGGGIYLENLTVAELSAADIRIVPNSPDSLLAGTGNTHVLSDAGETFVVSSPIGAIVEALGGDDRLLGGLGGDTLLGGAGNDILLGRDGDDVIEGGAGINVLTGGAGSDIFRLRDEGGVTSRDVITDFQLGVDQLVIDGLTGIASLEDVARRDTLAGLEFDLGDRVVVLAGYEAGEQFDDTDIRVIPGPEAGGAAAAAAFSFDESSSAPVARQSAAIADAPFDMRAWSVSVGGFDALQFGVEGVQTAGPVTVSVGDADRSLSPETAGDTTITIDGDDQGPVTRMFYSLLTWETESQGVQSATVAVLERAVTADYLLIPVDTEGRVLSGLELPTDRPITRSDSATDFTGEITLITDVEANGGILARDDRLQIANTGSVTVDVLANDSDQSGDALTITSVSQPASGQLVNDANSLQYTPDAGFVGTLFAEYEIADGTGLTDTATLRIDVTPEGYSLLDGSPVNGFAYSSSELEYVTLLPDEVLLGYGDSLNGDFVNGFDVGNRLLIQEYGFELTGLDVTSTRAVLELTDTRVADTVYSVTLLGDYTGASFRVSNRPSSLDIRVEGERGVILTEKSDRFITTDAEGVTVFAAGGDDVILTAGGQDILAGGAGDDVLLAGRGDDFLFAGTGFDTLTGGEGRDLFFLSSKDFSAGEFALKQITDFTPGTDSIELSGFDVTEFSELVFMPFGTGDALVLSETHLVEFKGLTKADLIATDFTFRADARDFRLEASPIVHNLSGGDDRFITIDDGANEVRGGDGNDVALGADGADVLFGGAGGDVLRGNAGADRLIGGAGPDSVAGGAGADVFVFVNGEETGFAVDFIVDYEPGVDIVELVGFDLDEDALVYNSFGNGDLFLEMPDGRLIVFEGFANEADLGATFNFL